MVPLFYDTLRAYRGDTRPLLELAPGSFGVAVSPRQKYELGRDRALERSPLGPLFRPGKLTPAQLLPRLRGERQSEDAVVAPGYTNGPDPMPASASGAAQHVREAGGTAERARSGCWDLGHLPWLADEDFRNGDHITVNTAARVSAVFEQQLESWLGQGTSHRLERSSERTASVTFH